MNARLRYENLTNDPAWPKIPFPSRSQCSSCVRRVDVNGDASEYDEQQVIGYLNEFYSFSTGAINERLNQLLLLCFSLLLFRH